MFSCSHSNVQSISRRHRSLGSLTSYYYYYYSSSSFRYRITIHDWRFGWERWIDWLCESGDELDWCLMTSCLPCFFVLAEILGNEKFIRYTCMFRAGMEFSCLLLMPISSESVHAWNVWISNLFSCWKAIGQWLRDRQTDRHEGGGGGLCNPTSQQAWFFFVFFAPPVHCTGVIFG